MAANRVSVRLSRVEDVYTLAANLRPADRAEVETLGLDPRVGIRRSFRHAILRKSYFVDGELAAMSGLCGSMLGDIAEPYLMTGPLVERVPMAFIKLAKDGVAEMLQHKLRLDGHVAAAYGSACRFLAAIGFTLDEPRPFGSHGAPFRRFHLNRDEWQACLAQHKIKRPGADFAPFIIYTAGRSRTAWLSALLTYGEARCHNEIAVKFRSMLDVKNFFRTRGTGSAETGVAPGWQLIQHHFPGIKTVVVRRPAHEIIASFARLVPIDEAMLARIVAYENRCLDRISAQPGVLTVDFADLDHAHVCAQIFEHCLPYRFDPDWWQFMRSRNVQASVADLFRYFQENRDAIEGFKRGCKRELTALARSGAIKGKRTA